MTNAKGGVDMEKILMLDVSENGKQIGEKLFAVLDAEQKKSYLNMFLSGAVIKIVKILLSSSLISIRRNNNVILWQKFKKAIYIFVWNRE